MKKKLTKFWCCLFLIVILFPTQSQIIYGSEEYVDKRAQGNNSLQTDPINTSIMRKQYLYYKGATFEFFNTNFRYRDYANSDDKFVLKYTYSSDNTEALYEELEATKKYLDIIINCYSKDDELLISLTGKLYVPSSSDSGLATATAEAFFPDNFPATAEERIEYLNNNLNYYQVECDGVYSTYGGKYGGVSDKEIDFGTVTTTYKGDNGIEVPLSIKWNLNYLLGINAWEDTAFESLSLLGLLLSQDAYNGTDSVAERMREFGLLNDEGYIWEGEDGNTNTGICYYISVKKIENIDKEYYIVTAVSRGTIGKKTGPEWLNNLFNQKFFKLRGDQLYGGIKEALEDEGLEVTDPRVSYFITGHSLGGAVSNYLSNKLWKNGVDIDNIACYTYASPFTCRAHDDKMQDGHIYNYIGLKDLVPTVGQDTDYISDLLKVEWGTHRFGKDIYMAYESKFMDTYNSIYSPEEWKYGSSTDFGAGTTAGNLAHSAATGWIYHELYTYLAQILSGETYTDKNLTTTFTVLCPVDVYVYDAAGNIVASVVDNTVVNEGNEDVIIAVLDDAKFITLKNEGDYTVKYIGTDTGTMSTTITKKTSTGETVKTFSNVALEEGKQMVTSIQENETSQDVRLFVVDDEQKIVGEITESGVETSTKLPNTDAKDNTRIHIVMFLFLMVLTIGVYRVNRKYKG